MHIVSIFESMLLANVPHWYDLYDFLLGGLFSLSFHLSFSTMHSSLLHILGSLLFFLTTLICGGAEKVIMSFSNGTSQCQLPTKCRNGSDYNVTATGSGTRHAAACASACSWTAATCCDEHEHGWSCYN